MPQLRATRLGLGDRFIHGLLFGCSVALWSATLPLFARLSTGTETAVAAAVTLTGGLIGIGFLWGRLWPRTAPTPAQRPASPELATGDVVLWRLRWTPDRLLSLVVGPRNNVLTLTIHEAASGMMTVGEVHPTIVSAVNRAQSLRDKFVAAGWEPVDVDLDEPD